MLNQPPQLNAIPLMLISDQHQPMLIERFQTRQAGQDVKKAEMITRAPNASKTGGYGYTVDQAGIATVMITGVITPINYALFDGGETITDWIVRDLAAIENDTSVSRVMFQIDSPGGYVAGGFEMADAIVALSKKKPTATNCGAYCCSGAYLAAVGTGSITAYKTSIIGSIGTKSAVIDWKQFCEKMGIKVIPIDSGGMKSAGLPGTEITQDQIDYFKSTVINIQKLFTQQVANGLGIKMDAAAKLADGRVHVAEEALKLGLINQIGPATTAYNTLLKAQSTDRRVAVSDGAKPLTGATHMSAEIKPASIAELRAEFKDNPDFALQCAEKALTMTEAKAAYCDVLRTQAKPPGVRPAASRSAEQETGDTSVSGEGAIAEFESRVAERMKLRNEARHVAAAKILSDDPDLRARFNAEQAEERKQRVVSHAMERQGHI